MKHSVSSDETLCFIQMKLFVLCDETLAHTHTFFCSWGRKLYPQSIPFPCIVGFGWIWLLLLVRNPHEDVIFLRGKFPPCPFVALCHFPLFLLASFYASLSKIFFALLFIIVVHCVESYEFIIIYAHQSWCWSAPLVYYHASWTLIGVVKPCSRYLVENGISIKPWQVNISGICCCLCYCGCNTDIFVFQGKEFLIHGIFVVFVGKVKCCGYCD